jgi:hypothetical protein
MVQAAVRAALIYHNSLCVSGTATEQKANKANKDCVIEIGGLLVNPFLPLFKECSPCLSAVGRDRVAFLIRRPDAA